MRRFGAALTALCLAVGTAAYAADISGAGATFPYPVYAKWAEAYKKKTGIGLNYQSIGSGGGIKQIKAKTVDLRRLRHAAEARELQEAGPRAVPDDHRRRGAGGEHQGRQPGQLVLDGADARRRSTWARSRSGTTRRSRS